jgi:hypothetical protein
MCLINYALCHEDVWGSVGRALPFLTLESDQFYDVAALPPRRKVTQYPFVRMLYGPQSRSGRCGEKKQHAPVRVRIPALQAVAHHFKH